MQVFENDNVIIELCEVGALMTCCYIIKNKATNEVIIVDPGADDERIEKAVKKINGKPVAILLTHGHYDHIMAVKDIASKYDIKTYIGDAERGLVKDASLNLSTAFGKSFTCDADFFLKDNEQCEMAGLKFKTIHTPGHTIGSSCYHFEDNGFLISGDTLFNSGRGRTDFPTGSESSLIKSIQNKLFTLDNSVKVFPGHGPATSIGAENYELWW